MIYKFEQLKKHIEYKNFEELYDIEYSDVSPSAYLTLKIDSKIKIEILAIMYSDKKIACLTLMKYENIVIFQTIEVID